ncbi:hypothetical protein IJS77_05730 [bacterium]|nr:hypothetical protein [bacterium]
MAITPLTNIKFRGNEILKKDNNLSLEKPGNISLNNKRDEFIEDAKVKIKNTGLYSGLTACAITAISLLKVNKLGIISKSLISAAVGTLASAAGMFIRSNMILNSPEYKKLFFIDYGAWSQAKKV